MARLLPALALFILGFIFPADLYGQIAVLATLFSVLMIAADGGFDVATTVTLSRTANQGENWHTISAGLLGRLLSVALVGGMLVIATFLYPAVDTFDTLAVTTLMLTASIVAVTASSRLYARLHSPITEARLLLAEKAIAAIACILIAAAWRSPGAYLFSTICGPLLIMAISRGSRMALKSFWTSAKALPLLSATRSQATVAIPVALGLAATTLYWRVDILILNHLLGPKAVGAYAVAYYPVMALTAVPGAASVLILRNLRDGWTTTGRMGLVCGVGALAAAFLVLVAPILLNADLMAAASSESATTLRVAAFGVPAMFVNPFLAMSLRRDDRAWAVTIVVAVALLINVAGNFALVPLHGIAGAAWSSTATEWSVLFVLAAILSLHGRQHKDGTQRAAA